MGPHRRHTDNYFQISNDFRGSETTPEMPAERGRRNERSGAEGKPRGASGVLRINPRCDFELTVV